MTVRPALLHVKLSKSLKVPPFGHSNILFGSNGGFVFNFVASLQVYRNDPKFSDRYAWANSADPDQTAPRGAV